MKMMMKWSRHEWMNEYVFFFFDVIQISINRLDHHRIRIIHTHTYTTIEDKHMSKMKMMYTNTEKNALNEFDGRRKLANTTYIFFQMRNLQQSQCNHHHHTNITIIWFVDFYLHHWFCMLHTCSVHYSFKSYRI